MKRIINIFFLILICTNVLAQNITIKGVVKDTSGQPVIGAAVMVDGNNSIGVVTDIDGHYTLTVPSSIKDPSIKVVSIGYKSVTISIGRRSIIDIEMEEDALNLDEVVVVGYGAMRRSDLTGSVTSLKIDEDDAAKSTTLDQMLDGRVSGVQVLSDGTNPDAGVSIRIRGLSTFSGSSEPLYVVDGIIVNGESQAESPTKGIGDEGQAETTNGLAGINTQDIESVEILKDASATAIYGSQGANGVVLITTKQGKSTKPVVNFNAGISLSSLERKLDILSFDGFVEYMEALRDNLGNANAVKVLNSLYSQPLTHEGLLVTPIDWQDYTMRKAVSENIYFSISGKPKTFSYLFSIGVINNNGVIKNTDSRNYNVRLNLKKKFGKTVELGFNSNLSYVQSNLLSGNGSGGNILGATSLIRSICRTKPYVKNNSSSDDPEEEDDEDLKYGPDRWLNNFVNTSQRFRVNPSLYAQWKMTPWLTFKSTLGGEFLSSVRFKNKSYLLSQTNGNTVGLSNNVNLRYNWDNLLMVNKKIKKHSISGSLGQSMHYRSTLSETINAWNLPHYEAGAYDINNASPEYSNRTYSEAISSLFSVFARAIYNYDDRYVLTATYRVDGSSKFQGRNKWSGFPSFAFAWRINNEKWFDIPVVSLMKLRLGWGQVGNQSISSYQTRLTYGSANIGNSTTLSGIEKILYPTNVNNPDLRWETAEQINLGLDLSLFHGRAALTVDVYNKDVKDLLQEKRIARDTGFKTMFVNQGAIRNRGLEISLDTTPIKVGGFEWNLSGNISFNRNTLLSCGDSDTDMIYLTPDHAQNVNFFYGSTITTTNTAALNIFVEGQPMGLFYGYKTDGIIPEGGEEGPGYSETGKKKTEGNLRYLDLNGNGIIDEHDRTIIGNPQPLFHYGFNTSFNYKGLSLKVRFNGAYDFDVFNYNNMEDLDNAQTTKNIRRLALYDAYSRENPNGKHIIIGGFDSEARTLYSDYYVEDASYLRLSDVTLSYKVPIRKASEKFLKGLNIGMSVNNVWTFTKYSGWNAAGNSSGSNINRMGVDLNTTPSARTYSFNLKFSF